MFSEFDTFDIKYISLNENIYKLKPGHEIIYSVNDFKINKYWNEDRWVKASYSLKGIGQNEYREILAKAENPFYFAGEHTAINYASMNGAIESGIRACNEIKMT